MEVLANAKRKNIVGQETSNMAANTKLMLKIPGQDVSVFIIQKDKTFQINSENISKVAVPQK